MRIAYLVLAHRSPRQFGKLAAVLTTDGDVVVAHVDARSDQSEFEQAVAGTMPPPIFTERRHSIRWGDFRMVQVELDLLRIAVVETAADYYVLLSGADYPIKPRSALEKELGSAATYMESSPMPYLERGIPMSRLEHFHLASKRRGRVIRFANKHLLPVLPKRDVARGLSGRQPFAGSQWWAMPRPTAVRVLEFADSERRFVSFFRWSAVPDEMFFQTIVNALPDQPELRPSLTFVDWSRERRDPRFLASPATLGPEDLPRLAGAPHFFARKFDMERTPELLPMIDARLLGR